MCHHSTTVLQLVPEDCRQILFVFYFQFLHKTIAVIANQYPNSRHVLNVISINQCCEVQCVQSAVNLLARKMHLWMGSAHGSIVDLIRLKPFFNSRPCTIRHTYLHVPKTAISWRPVDKADPTPPTPTVCFINVTMEYVSKWFAAWIKVHNIKYRKNNQIAFAGFDGTNTQLSLWAWFDFPGKSETMVNW